MTILICGSLAYDTIMVFQDQFQNHILPDNIHMLNVAFLVPEMRKEFGGTAGNIAYNLNLLGMPGQIMATVGDDFLPYQSWLEQQKIATTYIRHIPKTYTAQAFITTDLNNNQITAFHPGAMNHAHQNSVLDASNIHLGIIAPDGRSAMFQHAREFADCGIPFLFDPGQGLPMFEGDELLHFMQLATYAAFNDYEAQLVQDKTGRSLEQLTQQVKALIVTHGEHGSSIYTANDVVRIPCVPASTVLDPTGCGDAYRAGLLYGISKGWDWLQTGRLAAVMGSFKITSRGGQNHTPDRLDIQQHFQSAFAEAFSFD